MPASSDNQRAPLSHGRAAAAGDVIALLRTASAAPVEASGLPSRDTFIAAVEREMAASAGPVVMGVIRFASYARIAAFDEQEAARALSAFADGLQRAADARYPVAQVGCDTFALWFAGVPVENGIAQLHALSYLLAQRPVHDDGALRPRLELGGAVYPLDGRGAGALLARAEASLKGPRTFLVQQSGRFAARRR